MTIDYVYKVQFGDGICILNCWGKKTLLIKPE